MAVIYGLFDPREPLFLWEVRYIGQTTVKHPESRVRQQIWEAKRGSSRYVHRWIMSLLRARVRPHIHVLERCANENRHERECAWIAEGRRQGWRLTNSTDGGEGNHGLKTSASTRQKQSQRKIGKPLTEEHRRNAALATQLARQNDPTINSRVSASLRQFYADNPDERLAISERSLAWWDAHPEAREERGQKSRQWCDENPELVRQRGQSIANALSKQDKSPQMCDQCDGGPFQGPSGLHRHIAQVHRVVDRDTTPLMCRECSKGPFSGPKGLQSHQQRAHPNNPLDHSPLMCPCGRGPFIGKRGLKKHQSSKSCNL